MKKSSRLGCVIVLVLLAGSLLLIYSLFSGDGGETARRRTLAVSLKAQVEKHYQQHKAYPSVAELSMPDKELLISYIKSGVIIYQRDPTGKRYFVIRCIFADRASGKSGTSWNGIQYSNNRAYLLGVPDTWEPGSDGFFIWDRH